MGNGAIGPLVGSEPDDESDFEKEAQNIQTVRAYYERIYNAEDFDALTSLVTKNVKIHRDQQLMVGRETLLAQIMDTIGAFGHLRVTVQEIVASGARVSYRIDVEFDEPGSNPVNPTRQKVRGIGHCRLAGGRIVESWVHYEAVESA